MGRIAISKTKYLAGLQCHKLFWAHFHARDRFPPVDPGTQAIFDQGHKVGELAKTLFPDGIEVAEGTQRLDEVIAASEAALAERRPLYEAGFRYRNAYARFDILNPVGTDAWDLYEVKSGTRVKDVNIPDVAIQLYILQGLGLNIRRACLMHIDGTYVRHGDIDPNGLFCAADVTEDALYWLESIEEDLDALSEVLYQDEPDVPIGAHCSSPYVCALQGHCWSDLPPDNPTTLMYDRGKGLELIHQGVLDIKDIPDGFRLTDKQRIQVDTRRSGKHFIDRPNIRRFLKQIRYPISFLDFETFMTAIPPFDGVRPYQAIPFQYSLHIIEAQDASPEHVSFLANGPVDPRPAFAESLAATLPTSGSIIAYNASFEKRILKEIAESIPEHRTWIEAASERIVDLLIPFRSLYAYHPDQRGSASIKSVLPAFVGRSYGDLEVSEGMTANNEFLRITFGDVAEDERASIRKALEEYCALDTQAMIDLLDKLRQLVDN